MFQMLIAILLLSLIYTYTINIKFFIFLGTLIFYNEPIYFSFFGKIKLKDLPLWHCCLVFLATFLTRLVAKVSLITIFATC